MSKQTEPAYPYERRYEVCPVCAYDAKSHTGRVFEQWDICPCCGTEFNLDDQHTTHEQLRAEWIKGGMKWHSQSTPKPPMFNARGQLWALQDVNSAWRRISPQDTIIVTVYHPDLYLAWRKGGRSKPMYKRIRSILKWIGPCSSGGASSRNKGVSHGLTFRMHRNQFHLWIVQLSGIPGIAVEFEFPDTAAKGYCTTPATRSADRIRK